MKYCTKCGSQINDGINFCPKCGAKVAQAQPQAAPAGTAYVQPPVRPVYNQVPMTPAIRVLKDIGSSPLFLIAVIATTLNILLSFVSSVSGSGSIINFIYRLADEFDLGYILYEIPDEFFRLFSAGNIFIAIMSMIPSIIIVTGLWLIFAASVDKKGGKFSTAGLTVVKVMNIISLVLTCIGGLLVELVILIALIGIAAGTGSEEAALIMFIVMLVVLLVYAVIIMYYVKINKTIASAKNTALTGRPYSYASRFIGVICILAAVCSVFSMLSSAITGFYSFGSMLTGVLTALCNGVAFVCFGITIFTYRSQMSAVANAPVFARPAQPVAPAPASAPPVVDDTVVNDTKEDTAEIPVTEETIEEE